MAVETTIHDARSAGDLSWQTNGFELINHQSAVSEWRDLAAIEAVHYAEITDLARTLSGCDAVLFYPALLRSPEMAAEQPDLAPVQIAHSDYTEGYREMIGDPDHPYHDILLPSMKRAGVTCADINGARRVLTLQMWRNTGAPDTHYPLAVCDARDVPRSALIPIEVPEYGGVRTGFQSFLVLPPDDPGAYHWFTFPHMQPHEVLLFRAYDSERAEAGETFWTPHTAFADPNGQAPRQSVEMRAICLFG